MGYDYHYEFANYFEGLIDLGLDANDPKQHIMGMTTINGKVYVFTQDRVIEVKRKSRLRVFWERITRWRGGR